MNNRLDLTKEFDRLVLKAGKLLLSKKRITEIIYNGKNTASAKIVNEPELRNVTAAGGNVYALWVKHKGSSVWKLVYIGQRKSRDIHTRLIDHLFKKSRKTGSKLREIKKELREGGRIGVTIIEIFPDEMRMAIEERLIVMQKRKKNHLWNVQS